MSDTYKLPPTTIANVPAFISRLRPGRYTSPSGVESFFLFDDLSRTRAKKTAAHEIVDSDETVIQDMGSGLQVFSMSVYFVGENCDQLADAFYNSLYERYTPDAPGLLNHPRWGDVAVIPFGDPEQSESYVEGSGICRVSVVFRETVSTTLASSFAFSASGIADTASQVDESALDRASRIVADNKASYAKFKAVIRGKTRTITGFIDGVSDLTTDIADEIEALTQELYAAIDEGATPVVLLAQIGNILRTIAEVPTQGAAMVKAYYDMAVDIVTGFVSDIDGATTTTDRQNVALSLQYIGAMSVATMAVAETNAQYTRRDEVGDSIDQLVEAYQQYLIAMDYAAASLSMGIEKLFAPDHDVGLFLHGSVYDTQALLINRAFSLKSKRTYRLKYASDPLTETWTHYGDLDQLDLFCTTNKIVYDEFLELPAGREIAIYV